MADKETHHIIELCYESKRNVLKLKSHNCCPSFSHVDRICELGSLKGREINATTDGRNGSPGSNTCNHIVLACNMPDIHVLYSRMAESWHCCRADHASEILLRVNVSGLWLVKSEN